MDDAVRDHSTFSRNRERLFAHDVIVGLFNETVETAQVRGHLSAEHFSVDGSLIQAWAGHKSFVRKRGPARPSHGHGRQRPCGPLRSHGRWPDYVARAGLRGPHA